MPLCEIVEGTISDALAAAEAVLNVATAAGESSSAKASRLQALIAIDDPEGLATELEADPLRAVGEFPDEGAEAIETAGVGRPVEMLTLVGAKGLSARHVIVIGCDDVNLAHTSRLAFFVALTRARESLHLLVSAKSGGSSAPHAFLKELPGDCCKYSVHKSSGDEPLARAQAVDGRFQQWSQAAQWAAKSAKSTPKTSRGRHPPTPSDKGTS